MIRYLKAVVPLSILVLSTTIPLTGHLDLPSRRCAMRFDYDRRLIADERIAAET